MILFPYYFSEVNTMLTLIIEETTTWNPRIDRFETVTESGVYRLEHSLQAISKWESYYKVPFFTAELSEEQTQFYIQCMELDGVLIHMNTLTQDHFKQITDYILDNKTATSVKMVGDSDPITMTSELIYAIMSIHGIPYECDLWHFSRLNTLIQAVTFLKKDKKKMSKEEVQMSNAELNAQRRKELNTKG